jgi:hypothetical protein
VNRRDFLKSAIAVAVAEALPALPATATQIDLAVWSAPSFANFEPFVLTENGIFNIEWDRGGVFRA